MADCCCSPFGPGSGGGGEFAPIQNTRYWDPTFVGTSTGSIGAPYATLAPFFAELPTIPESGWELWLPPGLQLVPGGTVPDLGGGGLTLRGLSPSTTYFDSTWTIEAQTNEPQMDFHDLGLTGLEALGGTVHFELVNCFVDSFSVSALAGGSARLRSCQFIGCNWPTDGFTLEVLGGAMSGVCSWDDGRFWNVKFGASSTFTPGAATQIFVGCTFDGGITISNVNAPTLVMDAFSHASFVAAGVTFAGTVRVLGSLGFVGNWGTAAAPGTPARFIPRTNGAVTTTTPACDYPVSQTGTFSWQVTWRVSGTLLVTDSVAVTIMRNGIATALVATIPPSTVSGQASATFAANFGDGISVRLLQSASEAAAAWNGNFAVRATLIG